jgi:hypothetical protein
MNAPKLLQAGKTSNIDHNYHEKLLRAGKASKSDHNYHERERSQNSPSSPLHTTGQLNTTHCINSLKMNDNPRDRGKDEDPSFQTASREDN